MGPQTRSRLTCQRLSGLFPILDMQMQSAVKGMEAFGLIYLDLNRFKQVNDFYGHLVGDLYLREAALRMKSQLRPQDMLARLGGDEFAVVLLIVRSRLEVESIANRSRGRFRHEPLRRLVR